MSRWVTYYHDFLNDVVFELKVHDSKEKALDYFNHNYGNHFVLNSRFKADKLPASYGYPMRKYFGISATAFKKTFGISVDEALKIIKEENK